MVSEWLQRHPDAGRPILIHVDNDRLGIHYMLTSKYGKNELVVNDAMAKNADTEILVEFLDMEDGVKDED